MRLGREETDTLIAEVKKRQVIWDFAHEFYRDKKMKQLAWLQVCHILFDDFHSKSDVQKNAIVRHVMGRWRTIKDNYVRMRKKKKENNAQGGRRSRRYVFGEQLSFLERTFARKPNSSTGSTVGMSSKCSDLDETKDAVQEEGTTFSGILQSLKTESSLPIEVKVDHFEEEHQSLLSNSVEAPAITSQNLIDTTNGTKIDANDEDMAFFMSLMPSLKQLSTLEKFDFRIQTMKFLQSQLRSRAKSHQRESSPPNFQFAELSAHNEVSSEKMFLPEND